jgi:hypothetical protein
MNEYRLDTGLSFNAWNRLDTFTQGYIETAMWTLTDDDGSSLDYLGYHDVADETIAKAAEDCKAFQASYADMLADYDASRAGHHFWLTRNRHGAGFWDGDYDEQHGKALTEASHAYGEVSWYVGQDGFVHQA